MTKKLTTSVRSEGKAEPKGIEQRLAEQPETLQPPPSQEERGRHVQAGAKVETASWRWPWQKMAVRSDAYLFEKYVSRWGRIFRNPTMTMLTREAAADDVNAFAERLHLKMDGPIGILRDDIERFIINHTMNIDWYQRKLANATSWRTLYFVVSLLMLLLIPVIIAFMPSLVQKGVEEFTSKGVASDTLAGVPTLVTAQMSAVLTGFFAFHRALSSYFDKRELVGIWSRTMATLKQQLYSFEQSWDHRVIDLENREEFSSALREAAGKARDIVIDEQRQYYENLSYPNLDIGSMLKSAAADSAAAFAPSLSAAKDAAKPDAELARVAAQLDARILTLKAIVSQRTVELTQAQYFDDQSRLRHEVEKASTELQTAEMDRAMVARAQSRR